MGQEIPRSHFSAHDFEAFEQYLRRETEYLQHCFINGSISGLHNVGGFELEAWLVDKNALPVPANEEFLRRMSNPDVVSELSLFNVELNVKPQVLEKSALRLLHEELASTWDQGRRVAHSMDAEMMAIGIHPGVRDEDLTPDNMSGSQRYDALNKRVLALRQGQPIKLDIHGREHLYTVHHDVMLEAATTSFQIHLQVRPDKAVRAYNAAQIVSAPLVAASANAPFLFGRNLWDESRIPLFEQSVDVGGGSNKRVSFGHEYIDGSLFRFFRENLDNYPVLLPMCVRDSCLHDLCHLRLHNGTIWRWNRPLIGFDDGGILHLRIENRVVPAGPSICDMLANAAFFWGLVRMLTDQAQVPEECIPFPVVRQNFYNAARYSLESSLQWLDQELHPVADLLLNRLVPMAKEGLQELNIDSGDVDYYLDIISERIRCRQNGAIWQRKWVARHGKEMQLLSAAYMELQHTGKPVHEWGY